jgi:hypothetical protein
MVVEPTLFPETPEQIYERVFRDLKPRTKPPRILVEFCSFANPDSFVLLKEHTLRVRMTDLLAGAPASVIEALAYILLGKLFRKAVPASYPHRYKVYLNRKDMRRNVHLVRQIRGRKFVSGPQGQRFNLDEIFERLNLEHFDGLLARPQLGWSRGASRTLLGHYDPSHNAIIISKLLDGPKIPPEVTEYVVFHEMLHLRYPVIHEGARRRVHTHAFREAERAWPGFKQVKEMLKQM